jgi:hypothetical protein
MPPSRRVIVFRPSADRAFARGWRAGAGVEIRLHEADPDLAAAQAEGAGGMVLQPPTDKKGHALREAVILSPAGYAFVPSRRI